MIVDEVRRRPHCEGFKSISLYRIVDPSVDSHNNWAPAVANYGEADQDSCDAALREIIPRLQSTFDVAPDD
jgi:hypothetical protein